MFEPNGLIEDIKRDGIRECANIKVVADILVNQHVDGHFNYKSKNKVSINRVDIPSLGLRSDKSRNISDCDITAEFDRHVGRMYPSKLCKLVSQELIQGITYR